MKKIIYIYILMVFMLGDVKPSHAQWIKTNGPDSTRVSSLAVFDTNLVAGTADDGVFLSTDSGQNWTAINSGLIDTRVTTLAVCDSNLFAGTSGGGVFRFSHLYGIWTAVNFGLTDTNIYCLAAGEINIFAGTCGGGIFRSANDGENWTPVNSGLTHIDINCIQCITPIGTSVYTGTNDGIFVSVNDGDNWIKKDSTITMVYAFTKSELNLIAGSWVGTFLSTDNGETWNPVNSGPSHVLSLAVSDTNVYAGSSGMGVLISSDHGESWYAVNTGLTSTAVLCLSVDDTYLYAGTDRNGIWRRPLSDLTTALESSSTDMQSQFRLKQNYSNPFNATTTISFDIPTKSFVSLKIFDTRGREVSILLSKELPAGSYSHQWNGTGLASGVYFYRLETDRYIETKKLILLR